MTQFRYKMAYSYFDSCRSYLTGRKRTSKTSCLSNPNTCYKNLTVVLFFVLFICASLSFGIRTLRPIVDSLTFDLRSLTFEFFNKTLSQTNEYETYEVARYEELCQRDYMHLCYNENERNQLVPRVRQKIRVNPDIKGEALRALNQALDMQLQGKTKIAKKLFDHAHKMDPAHADILNGYGEFMEKHVKDIVLADHFYSKALIVEPEHSQALINRRRTMPVVEAIDRDVFKILDKKLHMLQKVPKTHPGFRRATEEAYYHHIYHTNAIEGNTLSLIETRTVIETRRAIGGKSLAEQNEALGTSAAMNYISENLINRVGGITLQHIFDIHRRVLGHVDPMAAGRIRTTHVAVGSYDPPPPRVLNKMMKTFITWLNSEEAFTLHPVEFAAIAHYRLVAIHPFYDGNGRTARCLMNLILMQYGYPPVTIRVDDRLRYYETLEQANDGDIRPFTRLIAECAAVTLDKFLLSTTEDYDSSQWGLMVEDRKVIASSD